MDIKSIYAECQSIVILLFNLMALIDSTYSLVLTIQYWWCILLKTVSAISLYLIRFVRFFLILLSIQKMIEYSVIDFNEGHLQNEIGSIKQTEKWRTEQT